VTAADYRHAAKICWYVIFHLDISRKRRRTVSKPLPEITICNAEKIYKFSQPIARVNYFDIARDRTSDKTRSNDDNHQTDKRREEFINGRSGKQLI
jgi:hypothetical protein